MIWFQIWRYQVNFCAIYVMKHVFITCTEVTKFSMEEVVFDEEIATGSFGTVSYAFICPAMITLTEPDLQCHI